MATAAYKNVLELAASLSQEEQLRLVHDLTARAETESPMPRRSILELQGLGKEIWEGIDAQEYVNSERSSWNG
jgi:hypothetical protein